MRTWRLIVLLVIAISTISVVLFVIPIGRLGRSCRIDDEYVRKTASSFQNYYNEIGAFPNVNDNGQASERETLSAVFLEGIKRLYHADMFSLDKPGEMFVYFKSNCKLKITPTSYDTFSR